MAATTRKLGISGLIKKLFWVFVLIYVVVNPLGAATAVHDVATWVIGFVHGTFAA